MMKKYLLVWTILGLLLGNACCAQVADSAGVVTSLMKCWRVFSHEYSTIYGLEEAEIKQYSKQRVCITRDSLSSFYGVRYTPAFAIKKVNTENYAQSNFDCNKRKLGIRKDSVYEVTISSMTRPNKDGKTYKMTDILAFDGECIYVMVDGVIFKMLDADAKVWSSASN